MSYPPPVTPGYTQQPPPGDWTPPAPKGRGPLPWLVGALVVAVLVVGGLIAVLVNGGNEPTAGASPTPPLPQDPCGGGICQTTTQPVSTGYTPKPSDFILTPKITDKQCFGSAGCNVDLEVKMTYAGAGLSDDDTWLVTYEITGDESGPIIGSIEVKGDTYEINDESLSTKSSKTKISIKVTDVEKRGL